MTTISSHSNPQFPCSSHSSSLERHTVGKVKSVAGKSVAFSDTASAKIHAAISKTEQTFDEHLNERIFAHVVGNGLLTSELEGNIFSDSMTYAADELERVCEGQYGIELPPEEMQELEQMQRQLVRCEERMHKLYSINSMDGPAKVDSCDHMSHTLLKEVASLKPGERMLLPGGWSSKVQGHAMLYELEKTSDGRVLFHLFNSGEGLQYHERREIDGETKFMCKRTWDLGKTSQLNENFEGIFSQLLQVRVGAKQNPNLSSVDDLYQSVLPKLAKQGAKELSAPACDPCWMSEQKSAICTWQCIMAWKKSHMHPQTYKRAKLCAKVRAFRQFALQYPEKLASDQKIRSLAQRALAKAGRQLQEAGLDKGLVAMENIEPTEESRKSFIKSKTTTIASTDHPFSQFIEHIFHQEPKPLEFQSTKRKAKPYLFSNIPWLTSLWQDLMKLINHPKKPHSRPDTSLDLPRPTETPKEPLSKP